MARPPEVRWSDREGSWVSDCGETYTDRSGRKRRRRVYFREDADGPIPFGPPRSAAHRRAAAELAQFIRERRGRVVSNLPYVMELLDAYVEHCEARVAAGDLQPRSLASIREAVKIFVDFPPDDPAGARLADALTPEDLDQFVRARARGNYGRRILATVKAGYAWARRKGLIEVDPIADYTRPPAPARTGRRPLRSEFRPWFRRAWASMRGKARSKFYGRIALLLVKACADTGARPSELCYALWSDFRPETLSLHPARHKTSYRGKARVVLFPRRWARALRWLRQVHPTYLFVHAAKAPRKETVVRHGDEDGEPWNAVALAQFVRKLDMPQTLYDLRRMVACELADRGLDYEHIADLLGNSPDLLRSVYVVRSVESLRRDFEGDSGQR